MPVHPEKRTRWRRSSSPGPFVVPSLVLSAGDSGCYYLVHVGAMIRVAAGLAVAPHQGSLRVAGGLLWAAAFALFAGIPGLARREGRLR